MHRCAAIPRYAVADEAAAAESSYYLNQVSGRRLGVTLQRLWGLSCPLRAHMVWHGFHTTQNGYLCYLDDDGYEQLVEGADEEAGQYEGWQYGFYDNAGDFHYYAEVRGRAL